MKKIGQKLMLIVALFVVAISFFSGGLIPIANALADGETTELKKFNVVFENYPSPSYIKYDTSKDKYDTIKEFFVIENEEFILSKTPDEFGKNKYTYNNRLQYSILPYSKNEDGSTWTDRYFSCGKAYYGAYIILEDTNGVYEKYEEYLDNYFVVMDEEGMDVPTFSATYNGLTQTATIPQDAKYITQTNDGGINVGQYEVVLKSKNIDVFFWNGKDRNQETVTTKFEITKETNNTITGLEIQSWIYGSYNIELNKPTATSKVGDIVYTYFDSDNNIVEDISKAKPGQYTLQAKIEETENYNGVTESVSFEIEKQTINKPAADMTEFVYEGTTQTYSIIEHPAYTISNNSQTAAGTYNVVVSFIDKDVYMWEDGTSEDLTFAFIIKKQAVVSPVHTYKEYNGELQIAEVTQSSLFRVVPQTGNLGGTDVGTYDVVYELIDPSNYRWDIDEAGTSKTYTSKFEIRKNNSNVIVDLKIVCWEYNNFNSETNKPSGTAIFGDIVYTFKTLSGEVVEDITKATVGRYLLNAKVEGTENYIGVTSEIEFQITKRNIEKPSQNTSVFLYNGAEQSYFASENVAYTITGNKQTNAGVFAVGVMLNDKDNYQWNDGTVADLSFTWVIGKAKIVGAWKETDGYLYFELDNEEDASKIEAKYYNKDNVQVEKEKFVRGEEYKLKIEIKDFANYELVELENGEFKVLETEKSFTYPDKPFFEKYWIYFLLSLLLLVAIIVTPIVVKNKRNKKQKEIK